MHGDHEQEQKIGSNYRALDYHKESARVVDTRRAFRVRAF